MQNLENILSELHSGDNSQLEVIFSDSPRLVVEAPAGCGKTTTMVSKIAYDIYQNKISTNKKIMALTFSVNAAYKMKKDVFEKLPLLGLENIKTPQDLNHQITITNYHGLARKVLKHYGYLLNNNLRKINELTALDDTKFDLLESYGVFLSDEEKEVIKLFSESVLFCDEQSVRRNIEKYNKIIVDKFLPNGVITFNSYLSLTILLFETYQKLRYFYQKLYPYIIIDEFQDTNLLSWIMVKMFISDSTSLLFMGDSLQRIYGFIGAIPNLLDKAQKEFAMDKIVLEKNYRFASNPDMLWLDQNIRRNAINPLNPQISNVARVNLFYAKTQADEIKWIVDYLESHQDKTAILVQMRNPNISALMDALDNKGIPYFYALFSDEDEEYIAFHRTLLRFFLNAISESKSGRVNKGLLDKVYKKICIEYKGNDNKMIGALLELSKAFFTKIISEYRFLENDEKIAYIKDTLEGRALKQNMDSIDSTLFVSTVHGAKGLEWNQVIMPDMEPYVFPNYGGLCKYCDYKLGRKQNQNSCKINVNYHDLQRFLEELSVFYVAVTRTKKSIVFSASANRYNNEGETKPSKVGCLMFLPGIEINSL